MFRYNIVLFTALLVLSIIPSDAKRTFSGGRHTYPSSRGGLSGGGHGYPSSGNHGYPSSGGLSGNSQGHAYPSSGGSHGYPSSGGMSGSNHGYPSSGGNNPSGGSAYPSNNHHSNTHGYPASKGLSGNTPSSGSASNNVHYHYHYSPPQQIRYTPAHGGPPVSYPVYRGAPPTYVYQYKDSGSKYGTLLAGLALLNLGTLAGGIYAASHHGSGGSSYKSQPGEICKFGIRKDNGDYEETRIDCQLISSFIYEEQAKAHTGGSNTTTTTTTTNTTTIVNGTGEVQPANIEPKYVMLPNGTLVPMNISIVNVTSEGSPVNNSMTSSVTVTTVTNTTVTNALDVKGKPVEVTPGMKCYVIRNSPTSNMRRSVPCGLLQTYAEKSLKRNSASRNVPAFTILTAICAALILY